MYIQFAQRNAVYQAKHIQDAVTEFSYKDGLAVYNHIFRNKHNLYGKVKMFDPDVDMADSFARIFNEQKLLTHDIIMLKHERHEAQLMSQGLDYDTAHNLTDELYNYIATLDAYKKGDNHMIKLFLKSDTDGIVIYDYYVDDIRDDVNHGVVKVSRSDKSYEVIKKDKSPFANAWAHAVRFALAAIDEEQTEQSGIVAWY